MSESEPSPEGQDLDQTPVILNGKYFKIVSRDGRKIKALCNLCANKSNTFSGFANATTNFLSHLKRCHAAILPEYEEDMKVDLQKRRSLPKKRKADSCQPGILTAFPVDKKKSMSRTDTLIANFVVKGIHPYSIVEEEGFRNLMKGLNPDIKVMSRQTLVRRVEDRYSEMQSSIIKKLDEQKYLCITIDVWTNDGKSRSFLGCTVHWIQDLQRQSYALACRRFRGSHTFDRIADLILTILHEYKIPVEKIVKAITDNGSNFLKAFREFSDKNIPIIVNEDNDSFSDEDIQDCEFASISAILNDSSSNNQEDRNVLPSHHPCSSHTLNLICSADITKSKACKLQASAFAKCQGIWNKLSRSTQAAEALREICGISLITPVCTRWNSFYDSLICLLKFENRLNEICKAATVPDFKTTEIQFMKEYAECVKPIAQGLDRLQGENNTFYGELVPTLLVIETKLKKMVEQTKPIHCEKLPQVLLQSLRSRFRPFLDLSLEHKDAILASISHPYFKLRWIPPEKLEEMKQLFITSICSEFSFVNEKTGPNNSQIRSSNDDLQGGKALCGQKSKNDDFFGYPDFLENSDPSESSLENIRSECQAYFKTSTDTIEMLHNFPTGKLAFIKYNTPIPSSGPVERMFNYSKMILSPNRRKLSDPNFEKLTLLKINNC